MINLIVALKSIKLGAFLCAFIYFCGWGFIMLPKCLGPSFKNSHKNLFYNHFQYRKKKVPNWNIKKGQKSHKVTENP